MSIIKHTVLAALIGTAGGLVSTAMTESTAHADDRVNPLDGQPAVRHRLLLVRKRFEVAPLFESTVNAEFRHIVGGGLKLEYHITDMWSVGVVGVASASINTSLVDKLLGTGGTALITDDQKAADLAAGIPVREPSQTEFKDHLNSMPFHGAAYLSLTPWYGKLAAFGSAFLNFDFYFQAGLAIGQLKSSCPTKTVGSTPGVCTDPNPGKSPGNDASGNPIPADDNPNNDPPLNSGTKAGLYLGGGIHVFLNDFMALDLTVRDYAFSDNPSGADVNADLAVTKADSTFTHHLFFGLGLSFMLPTSVKRTP